MTEKYLAQIQEDRQKSDFKQIQDINALLKDWSDKVTMSTKDIILQQQITLGSTSAADSITPIEGIVEDMKDRQSKITSVCTSLHILVCYL